VVQLKRFSFLMTMLTLTTLLVGSLGLVLLSNTAVANSLDEPDTAVVESPLPPPVWSHLGNQQFGQEGASLTAMDLNGDFYADLVVGEPGYDGGSSKIDAGRVLIFYYQMNMNSFPMSPDVVLEGTQAGAEFGTDTAVGDFNGDGVYDLAVGAPGRSAVLVYSGDQLDSNPSPAWSYTHSQADSEFGTSVLAIPPLATSGFSYELAVGAPLVDDRDNSDLGGFFLFYSSESTGLPANPTVVRYGTEDSRFGFALATGDFNNDFYKDLFIGAPGTTSDFAEEGAMHVYLLSENPLSVATVPTVSSYGGEAGAKYGYDVASADFNADFYADVLIGAPEYSTGGGAFIYYGAPGDAPQDRQLRLQQVAGDVSQENRGFGTAVTAVDYDQNGLPDAAIAANKQWHDVNTPSAGAVFIYFNASGSLNSTYNWKLVGRNSAGQFGTALAAADFNYDSGAPDDLLVGAPTDSNETTNQVGAVYAFAGTSAGSGTFDLMVAAPTTSTPKQTTPMTATIQFGQNVLYEWDFGNGAPLYTTYSVDESEPSSVSALYPMAGMYEVEVRALQPQNTPVEMVTRTIAVDHPITNVVLQSDSPTKFGNATQFRVGLVGGANITATVDFGNNAEEVFTSENGNRLVRFDHAYDKPGYYKVEIVAENSVSRLTDTIRVRVVRSVSANGGGQIRHEWGGDPARVFLVDVEPDTVDEAYELHFNPVADATLENPFPDDPAMSDLAARALHNDLKPLNIPVFFDLETFDPLSRNCLFLPLVVGDGSGSGSSGSSGLPPCLVENTAVDNFNEPLVLTFNYKDEDVPNDVDPATISFFYFDEEQGTWVDGANTCPGGSTYIREGNTIKLPICHQSRWAVSGG
jgi:hypothetical protein